VAAPLGIPHRAVGGEVEVAVPDERRQGLGFLSSVANWVGSQTKFAVLALSIDPPLIHC
jgi:hypothetical protein